MINEQLTEILKNEKASLCEDKRILGLLDPSEYSNQDDDREIDVRDREEKSDCVDDDENLNLDRNVDQVVGEDKENFDCGNVSNGNREEIQEEADIKQCPVEKLDLRYLDDNEKKKSDYADRVANLDGPFMSRSNDSRIAMLRCGEYSPNNPELRVHAKPFLGIGEYEQQQYLIRERLKNEYLSNVSSRQKSKKSEILRDIRRNILPEKYSPTYSKSVQTEIENIHCPLIQYDRQNPNEAQKELSPQKAHVRSSHVDSPIQTNNRELTSYRGAANEQYRNDACGNGSVNAADTMDKPKGILTNRKTGSPRDRYLSNLKHSYTPSFMDGFSYSDRTEELERERKKRETYNYELRMQIEEKRRLQAIKDEQDRREQELENKRLEQQLLRMQEEALVDDPKSSREEQARRHSDDYLRRRMDLGLRSSYRKHTDSESSVLGSARNALSHYSPPVSRRNPFAVSSAYNTDPLASRYNAHSPRYDYDGRGRRDALDRMDSLNAVTSYADAYESPRSRRDAFARFDSLSRIDSLGTAFESMGMREERTRRHSATQQDLAGLRRSPRLQRRSNSGRFLDDQLPIPVLKARSPVARELKNSVPFNSAGGGGARSSEACRRLEDKWQIPAVQKNIVNHSDSLRDGANRSILTQLGAIRMQLQQEQLRMDETLRKRGITQSKAVDFH